LHAGGRRFDPVWLHQLERQAVALNQIEVALMKFDADLIFESSFFNNLEISDVLTGSRGLAQVEPIDSIQVSHLHVARHGSTFVLNRLVMKLLAQKEATDWHAAQSLRSVRLRSDF
jgi:hypothetical protein